MAQGVPKAIVTHSQRVCRLYKKALRTVESYCMERHEFRYEAVLVRERFEKTRKEQDMRKLAAMLEEAEHEVWKQGNTQPFVFKNDPGGIMYNRSFEPSDVILDNWHPWERVRMTTNEMFSIFSRPSLIIYS
jgi:NADH dehydrogenase (ubiquinone) 1 beta subcomplex subunit 9